MAFTIAAACGGKSSNDDGGGRAGAAGGGAGGDSGNGDVCATATVNATCAAEGTICGTCTGPCQGCSRLLCQSGHWQTQEIIPAPCFDCGGNGLRCQIHSQYCFINTGPGPGTAMCTTLPDSCQPTPSCACLTAVLNCSGTAASGLTLTVSE